MRVDKREFIRVLSQLLCPGPSKTSRVDESWQARVCMYESFPNCHVLVKREQELHES